jgi:alkylated DNA repair dioxygenase AlkB
MKDLEQPPIGVDQYGNEIFQYQTSAYTDIKGLNVLGKDRKILLLGEKYNFRDVQNEFVKVPRIMQRKDNSYIDVMTGRTITGSAIKKMREKGDLSFRDYLGYQKVRDAYGNPVVASVDKQGNETYVYKLINLYGDGMYASEYYSDLKPSPLNNGTLKIEQEIPDADIIAYYGENVPAEQIAASQSATSAITAVDKVGPEFDKLPRKSNTPTMTYAGIGSRETPKEVLDQMTQLAKELESRGYTLRSGGAEGADTAFEKGVSNKKEIFPGGQKAGERELKIAREIHPNPQALDNSKNPAFVWNLMARNTNQVFGKNLDAPVDFVVAWTQDALTDYTKRSIKSGGTGQAIDMASRKGIPVINLANPNWRQQLNDALSQKASTAVSGSEMTSPVPGVENITNSGLTVEESNNFIDILQPQIIKQAYIENKARTANMMFSFGLRWAKNIPNESEKSEQAKNLGKPRPDRKAIKSKEGVTYGYYLTDQNNNPLPSVKELQPIIDFIQSKLGIDMSNYDAVLGNIYDQDSFIHQHRDTTESVTAEGYPVIVINLGADGHLEYDEDVKSTYPTWKKSGQLDLTNGGIYAFGVEGTNRFTFHHRIGQGLESANPLKAITLPNGKILKDYRITLTFRRAADLEKGMQDNPKRIYTQAPVTKQDVSLPGEQMTDKQWDTELAAIYKEKGDKKGRSELEWTEAAKKFRDQSRSERATDEQILNTIKCL